MDEHFSKIAKKLVGFEAREGQLSMFQDVVTAYEYQKTFLIEAGTGTGKSLAYLVPAMIWALEQGEPTVIATHTIALQEQLIQKDIPFLIDALGIDINAVLVKGMNNYVCLRKYYDNQTDIPNSLFDWLHTTADGSRSDLPIVPSIELWEQISADAESCTHVKCPHYKDCFFFKARKNAASAHLLIANHYLLFADLSLREESGNFEESAVLPPYKRLILDEAHHCEEVATQYFAKTVSRRGLIHTLGRLISDRGTGKIAHLYRKICEAYPEGELLCDSLTILLPAEKRKIIELVNEAFSAVALYLSSQKNDEKFRLRQKHLEETLWLDQVQPAIEKLFREGKRFLQEILFLDEKVKILNDPLLNTKCEATLIEIQGICSRLNDSLDALYTCAFSPVEKDKVRWIEGVPPDLQIISADLEIAPKLSHALFEKLPTIVLCSATLSTNQSFSFIRHRLGIVQAEERIYPSPFNYKEKTLLSVPIDLPDPAHPTFTKEASEKIWEAVEISKGGTFVLFTSYAMLRACKSLLSERLHKKHYLLYCQGDENRSTLLRRFKTTDKAVLFGTDSFWEGVDVAGEALRCVIIVKLPFKVPNDPLFEARSEAVASQGGSPFFDYSLPYAIVKFKQGFGRLIRNKEDKGCVICLDTRIAKKGYGKKFLQNLPECPVILEPAAQCTERLKSFYDQENNSLYSPII